MNHKLFSRFILILCLSLAVNAVSLTHASAQGPGVKDTSSGRLVLTGSSTMCPLMAEVGKRYESLHPEVRVEVQCGGSIRGITDVREGKAAIGMVSRALTEKEGDLFGFPVARDGVSVIINKDNPVKSLSNAQVSDIFTGRAVNWKQAGGRDAAINVFLREKGKPATELFNNYYNLKEDQVKGQVLVGDNPVTINAVASDRNAIGYVSAGEADRRAKAGVFIKLMPVNGVMPTNRNIITGNYPITRPLTLVTKGLPSGVKKSFLDFCLSSKVVDLIEKFEFVPYED